MDQLKIRCGTHGEVNRAFVCGHLFAERKTPLGFFEAEFDPDDPELEGWCQACEEMVLRDGDWTEETTAAADIRLVCEFCFETIRAFHRAAAWQLIQPERRVGLAIPNQPGPAPAKS